MKSIEETFFPAFVGEAKIEIAPSYNNTDNCTEEVLL